MGDSKFRLCQTRCDLRVRRGGYVRIDPECNFDLSVCIRRNSCERSELIRRIDGHLHAGFTRHCKFGVRFCVSIEEDAVGSDPGKEGSIQLTIGEYVGTGTFLREYAQNRYVAIRLCGVVNICIGERGREAPVVAPNAPLVSDIERRAVLPCELNDIGAPNDEAAVLLGEMFARAEIH